MKLRDYHCEEIELETSIPFTKRAWDRVLILFSKRRPSKRRSQGPAVFRFFLGSADKSADYHYHVAVDNSPRGKKKAINFRVSLHPNSSSLKKARKSDGQMIGELEPWLLGFMEPADADKALEFRWQAEFAFDRAFFSPVFPMPFKSPMEVPDGGKNVGSLSISGLKFKVDGAVSGLRIIYFETFEKVITVTSVFRATAVLKSGTVEQFLNSAAPVAALFVRRGTKQ